MVKVSQNAPEHHSGYSVPHKNEESVTAFGARPECQYPHKNGCSGATVTQLAYVGLLHKLCFRLWLQAEPVSAEKLTALPTSPRWRPP